MRRNSANRRVRSRGGWIVSGFDRGGEPGIGEPDDAPVEPEEMPRLARGVCWSDIVRDIERDRQRGMGRTEEAA